MNDLDELKTSIAQGTTVESKAGQFITTVCEVADKYKSDPSSLGNFLNTVRGSKNVLAKAIATE